MSWQKGSQYPIQVDTIGVATACVSLQSNFALVVDGSTVIEAYLFNDIYSAITAIEGELGVNPSTSYGTIREVVDAFLVQHNTDGTHKRTTITDTDDSSGTTLSVTQLGTGAAILASVSLGGGDIFKGYAGSDLKIKVANDGTLTGDKILRWSFRETPTPTLPTSTDGFTGNATFTLAAAPVVDPGNVTSNTATSEHIYVNGILQEVCASFHTGTTTAYTTMCITQTGAGWSSNYWTGYSIAITTAGARQIHKVASNTTDTIVLEVGDSWMPTLTVNVNFAIGNDYYINGRTITFIAGSIPPINATLKATYAYLQDI